MDRLTQDCDFCIIGCSMENKQECAYWTGNITLKCGDAQIYETLRAYELTGLTPAEIEALKAENARLSMASERAIGDITHRCFTCANSFGNSGNMCDLVCYVSGNIYCQSWQWRGADKGV